MVEDGKYNTLTEDPQPAIFWPMAQSPDNDTVLLVRLQGAPAEMIPAIRQAILRVDSGLPSLTRYLERSVVPGHPAGSRSDGSTWCAWVAWP